LYAVGNRGGPVEVEDAEGSEDVVLTDGVADILPQRPRLLLLLASVGAAPAVTVVVTVWTTVEE
jgi:hypothetical protein